MHGWVGFGFTLMVVGVAAWGLLSLWRVEAALTLLLRRARRMLDALELDQGAGSPEAHQEVLGVFDQMAAACPPLGRAWSEYAETLVVVDGRQRATRDAAAGFVTSPVLTAWQSGDRRLLTGRARANLPALCVRLGLLGTLASLVVLLATLAPAGPDVSWSVALPGVAKQMWISFVPLLVALPTSMVVRSQWLRWSDALDRAVLDVAFWIDTQYRTVTPAELLARLLEGQERMYRSLEALKG